MSKNIIDTPPIYIYIYIYIFGINVPHIIRGTKCLILDFQFFVSPLDPGPGPGVSQKFRPGPGLGPGLGPGFRVRVRVWTTQQKIL